MCTILNYWFTVKTLACRGDKYTYTFKYLYIYQHLSIVIVRFIALDLANIDIFPEVHFMNCRLIFSSEFLVCWHNLSLQQNNDQFILWIRTDNMAAVTVLQPNSTIYIFKVFIFWSCSAFFFMQIRLESGPEGWKLGHLNFWPSIASSLIIALFHSIIFILPD